MKANSSSFENYSWLIFAVLTILLSFGIALLPIPGELVPILIVFVPTVMAIFLTGISQGRSGVTALIRKLFQWRVSLKWYAIVLILALCARLAIAVLAVLLGWIPAVQFRASALPQFVILGVILLISAALEELGWRGYVLPRLLSRWSALFSGLLIGVLWGSIHLSLILPGMIYAGSTWLGTMLELIGLSVILTWFYVQTGGNILITTLFHTMQSFFVILNDGITADQQLLLMAVVYLAVSVLLVLLYGPNLSRRPLKGQPAVIEEG